MQRAFLAFGALLWGASTLTAQEMRLRFDLRPGEVLSYVGHLAVQGPPIAGAEERFRLDIPLRTSLFVLKRDKVGDARFLCLETVLLPADPRTALALGYLSRDGQWSMDAGFGQSAPVQVFSPLLVAPIILPDQPVASGSRWSSPFLGVPLQKDCLLEGIEGVDSAVQARIFADFEGVELPWAAVPVDPFRSTKQESGCYLRSWFSPAGGRIVRSEFRFDVSIEEWNLPRVSILGDFRLKVDGGVPDPEAGTRRADVVSKALELWDRKEPDASRRALQQLRDEAKGTPWEELASALLDATAAMAARPGEANPEFAFEATLVTLDVRGPVLVSSVLDALEQQVHGKIPRADPFPAAEIPAFEAKQVPFWNALDRLGRLAKMTYLPRDLEDPEPGMCFRRGGTENLPRAVDGAFLALLSEAWVSLDLTTGARVFGFGLSLAAEPKCEGFQLGPVCVLYARDDLDRWSPSGTPGSIESMEEFEETENGEGIAEFQVQIPAAEAAGAPRSSDLEELAVTVAVRKVVTWEEIRFRDVEPGMAAREMDSRAGTVHLEFFDLTPDGRAAARLRIRERKGAPLGGPYRFRLARGPLILAEMTTETYAREEGDPLFELSGFVRERDMSSEPVELEVQFPGSMARKHLRFTFRDVPLP